MTEQQAEYKTTRTWGGKRQGSGRRKEMRAGRTVSVYLDAETIQYLEAQAATISAAIRQVIKQRMDSAPRSLADLIQPAEAPDSAI